MVHAFQQIRDTFKAVDHLHYSFTPLDLTNWMTSLMRYSFEGTYTVTQSCIRQCEAPERERVQ